jgi:hypothetical protein
VGASAVTFGSLPGAEPGALTWALWITAGPGGGVGHSGCMPPTVPGYAVESILGRGGTGEVWLGRTPAGERVALKVIPIGGEGAATLVGVAQEASVAAVAAGEVGVAIHEVLDLGDRVVIVMELLEGGSLAGVLSARGHLSARECVTVLAPIAEGLARLHGQGIVHGDLTTGNIGFDASGRPRLLDFGASRLAPEVEPDIWGTTGFTAPEVAEGHGATAAADVYALAAVGWVALVGELPPAWMLRRPLREVLAERGGGPEECALAEVLQPALSYNAADRPCALDLASAVYAVCPARSVRLAPSVEEVGLITRRLRAAAQPGELGHLAAPGPEAAEGGRHRRPRGSARARLLRATRRTVVAMGVAALIAGGLLGVRALRESARAAAADPPTGLLSASPVRSTAVVRELSVVRDLRGVPARELVQELADARARALTEASADALHRVDVAPGAALSADRRAIEELLRTGHRYSGLGFTVEQAAWVRVGAEAATVRATVTTTAYQVLGGDGAARVGGAEAATTAPPVELDLVWTPQGWRVNQIRAG